MHQLLSLFRSLGLISLWLFAVKANVWNKRTFSFLSVAPTHPTISSVVNTYLPVTHTLVYNKHTSYVELYDPEHGDEQEVKGDEEAEGPPHV